MFVQTNAYVERCVYKREDIIRTTRTKIPSILFPSNWSSYIHLTFVNELEETQVGLVLALNHEECKLRIVLCRTRRSFGRLVRRISRSPSVKEGKSSIPVRP